MCGPTKNVSWEPHYCLTREVDVLLKRGYYKLSLTRNVDLQGNSKRIKVVRAETFQRQCSKQATHEFPGYFPPLILLIIQQIFMSVCYYVQSTVLDAKDTTAQKQTEISNFRSLHFREKKTTINKSNIEYIKQWYVLWKKISNASG